MFLSGRTRTIILSSAILLTGIIHLGVGIGIVAKYHTFGDTFQQQIGLAGFNIFVGLCTIIVGIVGLVAIINQYPFLIKVTAIASFILGIIALVSLITALALSGNAVGYLHDSINDNMNNYDSDQDAADTIDKLQTTYQCCGVNLWLDWGRILLGSSFGRRRRRDSSPSAISSLTRALRRKRQTIYNFPSSYGITLPFSCCTSGGVTNGNSDGGDCVFNASSDATSFYLGGCLVPVANIGLSQITGIAVINTCLAILAFVYFAKFITVFKNTTNPNNSNNGQQYQGEINQVQQQQQQPYPSDPYYMDYSYPYPYYISDDLNYKTYM